MPRADTHTARVLTLRQNLSALVAMAISRWDMQTSFDVLSAANLSCSLSDQFVRALGITFRHVGEILSEIFSAKKTTHIEFYLHESAENS
jgi:hypothetical protein